MCAGCGESGDLVVSLCRRCHTQVAWLDEALPFSGGAVDRAHAAAFYRDPVETWLRRFKYPGRFGGTLRPGPDAIARTLIDVATRTYRASSPVAGSVVVVAIPSPAQRIRQRGFHPAASLAGCVATTLGRPLLRNALVASSHWPSQTGLSRAERRRNVVDVFGVTGNHRLDDAAVLLVDDIVTTGATLESAARTLRKAGATRVDALCAAHAAAH